MVLQIILNKPLFVKIWCSHYLWSSHASMGHTCGHAGMRTRCEIRTPSCWLTDHSDTLFSICPIPCLVIWPNWFPPQTRYMVLDEYWPIIIDLFSISQFSAKMLMVTTVTRQNIWWLIDTDRLWLVIEHLSQYGSEKWTQCWSVSWYHSLNQQFCNTD